MPLILCREARCLLAESHTRPVREKQEASMMSLSISRKNLHTVIANTSNLDHRNTSDIMKLSSNAIRPQVTTRDSRITKESKMSQRGVHPLLRGHGQPKREAAPTHRIQASGLESGQRKRYLRCLEAEQAEMSSSTPD